MLNQFYGEILPTEGYYCLVLLPEGRHLWAESLEELEELTVRYANRTGVYYGTAAFASVANRKQANVLSLKALRLDIDAGPDKLEKHGPDAVYATQKEAVTACYEFFKATKLVPTYLVSSGAGLHIYYCLDTALRPDEWESLAKGLSRLGKQHGLKIDPSVTEDSARILRPVGALHHNGKRVSVLRRFGVTYDADALRAVLPAEPVLPRGILPRTGINAELDLTPSGPPSSALKIAEHCGALREVAVKKGDVQEPYWRAMIGLVKRTTEGIDIAQEWSSGYDGYDPDEVDRKFEAWATGPTTCAEFAKHTAACSTCKYNGKVKSPISLGLMTASEIETLPEEKRPEPATLPKPAVKAGAPWEGCMPDKFEVVEDKAGRLLLVNSIVIEVESETGDKVPTVVHVPVTHDIFWFGHWSEAGGTDDNALVTLCLWTGNCVRTYMMDQSLIASQAKLLEFLAGKSIHTTNHQRASKAMQDYAKAQLQRIRSSGKRLKVNDRLGMRILPDGSLVCAHGKHVIFGDGHIELAQLGPAVRSVADQFPLPLPESNVGEWGPSVFDEHILPRAKKHVEFLKKYYGAKGMERFQLAIMLGLASPFMPFIKGEYISASNLPRSSALSVALYSRQSARGKTTAVSSAILAYGNPSELANDSGRHGSTDNARYSRLSIHGTMPNIMDEMGGATPNSVAAIVSSVANGAARARSTRSGGINEAPPWALINLMTTNTSQRDMIASVQDTTGAIQFRLLEINVDDMPLYDNDLRAKFMEDWSETVHNCVGALGAMIHREICAMGVVTANRLVMDCAARAAKQIGADQNARFQYWGLGAVFALHIVLNKLGLAPFDLNDVIASFKEAYDAGTQYVGENVLSCDGRELMRNLLRDLAPNTVITEFESHTGRHSTRYDEPLNPRMPDVIHARHIKTAKRTYVAVSAIREWCKEKNVSYREMVHQCREAGVIRTHVQPRVVSGDEKDVSYTAEYFNLTKGLRSNMNLRTRCLTVDVGRLYASLGADPDADDQTATVHELHPDDVTGT